ncbi:MAG: hypothetical protein ACRBI6_14130 [Acidimicrobiales bacterium]
MRLLLTDRVRRLIAVVVALSSFAVLAPASPATASRAMQPDGAEQNVQLAAQLIAQPEAAVWPGGVVSISGAIFNPGVDALAAPVELRTVDLPPGFTVHSLTPSRGVERPGSWTCRSAGDDTVCQFVGLDGDPIELAGEDLAAWRLLLAVDPGLDPDADEIAPITLVASSASGSLAPAHVAMSPPEPDALPLDFVAMAPHRADHEHDLETSFAVTNLAATPRAGDEFEVREVVPPGASSWSWSGDGWACDDDAGRAVCRWQGPALETAAATSTLVVVSTHPELAADEAADGRLLEWQPALAGLQDGGRLATRALETTLVAGAEPSASLVASSPDAFVMVAPDEMTVDLTILGDHLDNATGPLTLEIAVPDSVAVEALEPDRWACADAGAVTACTMQGVAPVGDPAADDPATDSVATDLTVPLRLTVGTDAPIGVHDLGFALVVPGEPAADRRDNHTTLDLVISEQPEAALAVEVHQGDGPLHDGAAIHLDDGQRFGVGAVNRGSGIVRAGEEVSIRLASASGIDLTASGDSWHCTATEVAAAPLALGEIHECTHALAEELLPEARLDTLWFEVADVQRGPGATIVPIELGFPSDAGGPATAFLDAAGVIGRDPVAQQDGALVTSGTGVVSAVRPAIGFRPGGVPPTPRAAFSPYASADFALPWVGVDLMVGTVIEAPLCDATCASIFPVTPNAEGERLVAGQRLEALPTWTPISASRVDVEAVALEFDHWEVCEQGTCVDADALAVTPPPGTTFLRAVYDVVGTHTGTGAPTSVGTVTASWGVDTIAETSPPTVGTLTEGVEALFVPGSYEAAPPATDLQWLRCDDPTGDECVAIDGAVGAAYTPVGADVGSALGVEFTVVAPVGVARFRSPLAVVGGQVPVNVGAPSIAADEPTPGVNRYVADAGQWTGAIDESYFFEFEACDAGGCTVVQTSSEDNVYEATLAELTAHGADLPELRVRVRATNRVGTAAETTSAPASSVPVPLEALAPTVLMAPEVTLVGVASASVGTTLEATTGTWAWSTFESIRWDRCAGTPDAPVDCQPIDGETTTTLELTADEAGLLVRAVVTGSNPWHGTIEAASVAIGPISTLTPQLLTPATITVAGAPPLRSGSTLEIEPGTWSADPADPLLSPTSWTYQWQRCATSLQSSCVDVAAATGTSLELTDADVASRLRVVERVVTAGGEEATHPSALTAPVAPTGGDDGDPGHAAPPSDWGLCAAIDQLGGEGGTLDLGGGFRLAVDGWAMSTPTCTDSTTVSFTGASISLGGVVSVSRASGSLSALGLRLTDGEADLSGPGLDGLEVSVGPDPIVIDLSGPAPVASGSFLADGLIGITVPDGWTAATLIDLVGDPSNGSSGTSATVVAAASPAGAPRSAGATLPDPAGGPAIRMEGSLAGDGSLDVGAEVTGLVQLGDATIDLSGRITRSAADAPVTLAIAGTLEAPASLASDTTLTSAHVEWTSAGLTGRATVAVGDVVVSGSLGYEAADDWFVALEVGAPGPVSIAPGLRLEGATLSGEVRRSPSGVEADIEATLDRWRVGGSDGIVLRDASFSLALRCVGTTRCTTSVAVAAAVTIDLGGGEIATTVAGSVDATSGDFTLTADLEGIPTPAGLEVDGVRLVVERRRGAVDVDVRADVSVLGTVIEARLELGAVGTRLSATLDRWTPIPGGPTLSDVELAYSSTPSTVERDGIVRSHPARTFAVTAVVAGPAWIEELVGAEVTVPAIGSIDTASGSLSLSAPLPQLSSVDLFDVGGVRLELGAVSLDTIATSGSVIQRLAGEATFTLPDIGFGGELDLAMRVTAEARTGSTSGFSASVSLPPGRGWSDAFGVPGLDIDRLTVAVDVTPAGSTVGLAGEASLPAAVRAPLGITAGTPVSLAASVGVGPPCFAFAIGDGEQAAIDVFDLGVVTADEASFVLAPSGCAIGDEVFPPGASVAFDGTAFGVDITASVSIDPVRSSLRADLEVGRIDLVGVGIDDVVLHVESGPDAQSIEIAGELSLFGSTAAIDGRFQSSPSGTDVQLEGRIDDLRIGGFGIDHLEVAVDTADSMRSIEVRLDGSVDLLGGQVDVDLDVETVDGVVVRATGSGLLQHDIGGLGLDVTVSFDIEPGEFPDIAFAGSMTMAGLELGAVDGQIGRRGATLHADLVVPGLLDARLGGWVAFPQADAHPSRDGASLVAGGIPTDARPGDFRLRAENVTLGVAGFGLRADIDAEVVAGVPRISVDAELQVGTSDTVGGRVRLMGTIDGETGLDLSGSGALIVAEHELVDASFEAFLRPDGASGVSVTASIDLGGGSAELTGSFERGAGHGTLFRLEGRSSVSAGAFDFSDVDLLAVRDLPGPATPRKVTLDNVDRDAPLAAPACEQRRCSVRFGFVGRATLAAPAIGEAKVDLAFSGGDVAFSAKVRLEGPIGDALGKPRVTIAFDSDVDGVSELSFRTRVSSRWGVPIGIAINGTIRSDGTASLEGAVRARGHWELNIPFGISEVKFWTWPAFTVDVDIDLADPSRLRINATIDGRLAVLVQWVSFVPSWARSGWSRVLTIHVVGSTRPRRIHVSVDVAGLGSISATMR